MTGMHPFRTAIATVLATICLGATAAAADGEPVPAPPTPERAWTARILYPVAARTKPVATSRVRMKLKHFTPWSAQPARYLVMDTTEVSGRRWVQLQLPVRPNGSRGWVPEDAVDYGSTAIRVRVRLGARRVEILRAGKVVKRFAAAVGTGGTPTPRGLFSVYDPVATNGLLGPRILVLTAFSPILTSFAGGNGIVGIHGWPTSSVLGKAVSHGCVRMSRDGVRSLARFATAGTPVEIVR